jgi:hypothetical protein
MCEVLLGRVRNTWTSGRARAWAQWLTTWQCYGHLETPRAGCPVAQFSSGDLSFEVQQGGKQSDEATERIKWEAEEWAGTDRR